MHDLPGMNQSGFRSTNDGPAGLRLLEWAGVLGLATVLLAITPLAWATAPDQTWQPGDYDGADFDDMMLLATTGMATLPAIPSADRVLSTVRPLSAPAKPPIAIAWPVRSLTLRAPPAALAIF
jgi:hypothetical protein